MMLAGLPVLVIEDDDAIRNMMRVLLESQRYRVVDAATGQRGILEARIGFPSLILVDLGLPDIDGTSVIREIRRFASMPILVLTARTTESEKLVALDAGANDYVTKPFGAADFLARVRAALRRPLDIGTVLTPVELGAITIDVSGRTAWGPGGLIHLSALEFRVLECLTRSAGLIVTQTQLIGDIWGPDRAGDSRGLRSQIKLLRQKLEPDPSQPRYLVTEAGLGYRLRLDESGA